MARGDAVRFYKSQRWKDTRNAYMSSVGGLCEVCLRSGIYKPAEIIHHKVHIDSVNVYNPEITVNWNNLQAVCRQCHADAHEDYYKGKTKNKKRYRILNDGTVESKNEP